MSLTISNMTVIRSGNTTVMSKQEGDTPPVDYFPQNDQPTPRNLWRSHAHLLYGNWINEGYQTTPFDINEIGT